MAINRSQFLKTFLISHSLSKGIDSPNKTTLGIKALLHLLHKGVSLLYSKISWKGVVLHCELEQQVSATTPWISMIFLLPALWCKRSIFCVIKVKFCDGFKLFSTLAKILWIELGRADTQDFLKELKICQIDRGSSLMRSICACWVIFLYSLSRYLPL